MVSQVGMWRDPFNLSDPDSDNPTTWMINVPGDKGICHLNIEINKHENHKQLFTHFNPGSHQLPYAVLKLGQRRRRCPSLKTAEDERLLVCWAALQNRNHAGLMNHGTTSVKWWFCGQPIDLIEP